MSNMITFPDTWEEFEKLYGFNDAEEIYTNNSRLIPSFRVKQWLDHLPSVQGKPFNLPEIYIAEGYDTIEDEDGNVGFGVYVPDEKQIYVVGDVDNEVRLKALFHELCHWVQDMCGRPFDEDEANRFAEVVYDALPSAQPELCEDAVSRREAIKAIEAIPDGNWKSVRYSKEIRRLPSVTPNGVPDINVGKWIPHKSVFGGLGEKVYTCDKCIFCIKNYTNQSRSERRGSGL